MDLKLLETLKEKLTTAKEFTKVFEYFLDHFGEDPEFIALGERVRHPFIEAILPELVKNVFGRDVPITRLFLIRLPDHGFIHGGCTMGGRIANLLYFEDIQVGLAGFLITGGKDARLMRFSGRQVSYGYSAEN